MSRLYEALRRDGSDNLPPPPEGLLDEWERRPRPDFGRHHQAPPRPDQDPYPGHPGQAPPAYAANGSPNGAGPVYGQPPYQPQYQPQQPPQQQQQVVNHVYRVPSAPPGDVPALWMLELDRWPGMTENFRAVKNAMVHVNRHKSHKSFLITGPNNKVGTSVVAFNTALMLAWDLADQKIVVVDANLTAPSLHMAFGVAESPGLTNLLLDDIALEAAVQASPLPNLDLVTVGRTETTAASPFDLEMFSFLLEELNRVYDFVILDSAPALKSSQTRTIAAKVDASVVVARANSTRWEVVMELKRVLEADGATLLGSVLNKRQFVIPQGLYRYL